METETGIKNMISLAEEDMKSRVEKLQKEFSTLRTGRANPQILDNVKVEYFGVLVPIKQVAAVMVPEARILEIRPWDITTLEAIDKALQKSDLGVTPANDGKVIRLAMPAMSEDRRRDMVKMIKKMAEDSKVAVRGARREAIEKFKKAQKAKEISEDELARLEQSTQKMTDSHTARIDEILAVKEREILTV